MNNQIHMFIDDLDEQDLMNIQSLLNKTHGGRFVEISGKKITIPPFDIVPPEDCDLPKKYPHCCEYHENLYKACSKWFSKFPNCCDHHKELSKKPSFVAKLYIKTPKKVLMQLAYTTCHIENHIELENWYENITNYFEYNFYSFGQPSIGQDRYVQYLKLELDRYIKKSTINLKVKYNKLKEFLSKYDGSEENSNLSVLPDQSQTDLNLLMSTFQKWINSIPDIKEFSEIKKELFGKIPLNLFLYETKYNPYLGITKSKIRTKQELVAILTEATKEISLQITGDYLNLGKNLSEFNKQQLIIINESHKIKQLKLLSDFSGEELEYIRIIKTWLKNEEIYFSSVKPLLIEKINNRMAISHNDKKTILLLSANPDSNTYLRLEDEMRKIKDEISASSDRDKINVIYEPGVSINAITKAMQTKPSIVHFSGHGAGVNGLLVLDERGEIGYFPTFSLNKLFKLYKSYVKCVVLNACYSAEQAKTISQNGIYVIGMNDSITDEAATNFATGFYQSFANGNSIKFSFQIGLINLSSLIEESNIPELWKDGKKIHV